jgi:ribosomal protein L11 methyltransferase
LRRLSFVVPVERAEEARAHVLAGFPEGFEEAERPDGVELAVYTDADGEERLRRAFPGADAVDVPDDWRDRWRAFHRGVVVGGLWVGPPWEQPPEGPTPVVVDPGRAFGTGAHATTRLCLELLQLVPRGTLLDAGCGSGVLAIAAARLGFAPVIALDVDPDAVAATEENARLNGVELDVRLGDALAGPLPETDVAVANITGEALPWLPLRSELAITSGYLAGEDVSLPAYEQEERRVLEGWAADLFRRRRH